MPPNKATTDHLGDPRTSMLLAFLLPSTSSMSASDMDNPSSMKLAFIFCKVFLVNNDAVQVSVRPPSMMIRAGLDGKEMAALQGKEIAAVI